nr:uncharacterized protein LOC110364354 isoform X2 [Columba livia]
MCCLCADLWLVYTWKLFSMEQYTKFLWLTHLGHLEGCCRSYTKGTGRTSLRSVAARLRGRTASPALRWIQTWLWSLVQMTAAQEDPSSVTTGMAVLQLWKAKKGARARGYWRQTSFPQQQGGCTLAPLLCCTNGISAMQAWMTFMLPSRKGIVLCSSLLLILKKGLNTPSDQAYRHAKVKPLRAPGQTKNKNTHNKQKQMALVAGNE